MAPPVEAFPASQLPWRVQTKADGKRRKMPVKLEECELLEMAQYECWVEDKRKGGRILCETVDRLFRKCADGLMVETTAWEGERSSGLLTS